MVSGTGNVHRMGRVIVSRNVMIGDVESPLCHVMDRAS